MSKFALPDVTLWALAAGLVVKQGLGICLDESQYAAGIIAHADIVSFWPMENDWQDSVGTNHGTPQGGVDFTDESIIGDYSGAFDGVDGIVTVGADSSLDVQGAAFALETWIRPDNWTDAAMLIFSNGGSAKGFFLAINRGTGGADVADSVDLGKGGVIDQAITIEWPSYEYDKRGVHLVVNQNYSGGNPTNVEVFLNKVSQGTLANASAFISPAGETKQFGFTTGLASSYYKGVIDSFAIYSDVLSQADINDHYNKRYPSNEPVAEAPWLALLAGTLDATTPINILVNKLTALLRVSTGSVNFKYAVNNGVYNGSWLTLAQLVTALQSVVITNTTNSIRFKAQFVSDGTQGADIVIASEITNDPDVTCDYPAESDVLEDVEYANETLTGTLKKYSVDTDANDPLEHRIMQVVATRLATITTALGYKTNAGNDVRPWEEFGKDKSNQPSIFYRDTDDDEDQGTVGKVDHVLTVELTLLAVREKDATEANALKQIREIVADVKQMVGTDTTWSDLAETTQEIDTRIDMEPMQNKQWGAKIFLFIDYRTDRFNAYS